MEAVFLKVLNMSITASWIVLAVIVMRLLLRRAPKWITVLMWGLVGIRLVCPFSPESVFSLIPSAETVPDNILYTNTPAIHSGIEIVNSVVNPMLSESLAPKESAGVNPMQAVIFVASVIWIAGIAVMLIYMAVSYLRIYNKVREAVPFEENIWVCDHVDTPFILGVLRPRIYLSSAMSEQDMKYVIAHEKTHLKRKDHWWKPLGFLLLTIYWFHPVLWIAYILLCRDIELACDEKVIRDMGAENKKTYSDVLINCSVPRRTITACPLAFGEIGVKERVKSVLHYKKPAFWIIVIALISCVVIAVCFLTDPATSEKQMPQENVEVTIPTDLIPGTTYVSWQCLYMHPASSYMAAGGDSGSKYIVGEDYFATYHHNENSVISGTNPSLDTADGALGNVIDVPKWEWQEFPYTDGEWAGLYITVDSHKVWNISEIYDEILYQPLTDKEFLLRVDGSLWLVELNPQAGGLWSIYSLVPESVMGVAQWEYAPMLSSRLPVFRFEFEMDYDEVSVFCTESGLVDFGVSEDVSDHMVLQEGDILYWSPLDKDGVPVTYAEIKFFVGKDGFSTHAGTIYIKAGENVDGRTVYTASLVGTGLHLSPNTENEGGKVSVISSPEDVMK